MKMWNEKRYESVKIRCQSDIDSKRKTPYDYMIEYKRMVRIEDYEACKAITDVLNPLHYDTADTHDHIESLKTKRPWQSEPNKSH